MKILYFHFSVQSRWRQIPSGVSLSNKLFLSGGKLTSFLREFDSVGVGAVGNANSAPTARKIRKGEKKANEES